ncbi:hypothetical protein N0V93_009421 [Gnomoniopsis smithogilvyi]|uniref:Uncharacterized protein n=1 Tax=Gnomoniopsis smithogilvyi TaxID=1191159 RepID=A0A9W8YJL7_9PEZI|nr:hypothetical protein N0V93_009421 [Gnomoniopsis smithogilvyi]
MQHPFQTVHSGRSTMLHLLPLTVGFLVRGAKAAPAGESSPVASLTETDNAVTPTLPDPIVATPIDDFYHLWPGPGVAQPSDMVTSQGDASTTADLFTILPHPPATSTALPSHMSLEDPDSNPTEALVESGLSMHSFNHHVDAEEEWMFTTVEAVEPSFPTGREPDKFVTAAQGEPTSTAISSTSPRSSTTFTAMAIEEPDDSDFLVTTVGGKDNVQRRVEATPSTLSTVRRAKRAVGITEVPLIQTEAIHVMEA